MLKATFIRDRIVKLLDSDKDFEGMVAAEINGCLTFGVDIALPDGKGNSEVYRIAVVKHGLGGELK